MEKLEKEIGQIDHYYGNIHIAGIHVMNGHLKIGDWVHIKGQTTDFTEQIQSMEVNHHPVREVGNGAHVGVPVHDKVRIHDKVYRIQ